MTSKKSLLLCSGGVDSAYILQSNYYDIGHLLFVDYGQPANFMEHRAVRRLSYHFCVQYSVIHTPLISEMGGEGPSVVPVRNLSLISTAANFAASYDYKNILIGAIADDNESYADCRPDYLLAASQLIKPFGVELEFPLAHISKSEIMKSIDPKVLELTWSCYEPVILRDIDPSSYHDDPNAPFSACGICGSCISRNSSQT